MGCNVTLMENKEKILKKYILTVKRCPTERAKQKQSTGRMKKKSKCTSMMRRAWNRIYTL